jgi:hypothetical protein
MKLTSIAALTSLLLAPVSAHALLGTEVGARGGGWAPQLSGELRLDGAGTGTTLDLKDDLDLEDSLPDGVVPFVEAFVRLGKNRLSLAGASVDYSGSNVLASPIDFGGESFLGNVHSSLKYSMVDLAYERNLLDLENWAAGFSVSAIVDVKYLTGEVKMHDATNSVKESFSVPMPLLGLGAHIGILLDLLEARVRAVGMGYRGNRVIDAFGEIVLSPFPFVDLGVGYRYFQFKADSEDIIGGSGGMAFDYTQAGPYVNLTLKIAL